jgi:hypothetical protein
MTIPGHLQTRTMRRPRHLSLARLAMREGLPPAGTSRSRVVLACLEGKEETPRLAIPSPLPFPPSPPSP